MARDYNVCVAGVKDGTILTCKARAAYPSLFKATDTNGRTDGPENKLKYRLVLLFPKSANLDYLVKRVNETMEDLPAKDRPGARKPFIKTADVQSLAKYADDYPVMIRVNSKYPPQVVGPNKDPIQEDEAYGGRWCVASLNPYTYPSIDGGKPGVALGLGNVQFLDHDDPIGGARVSAEDEFEAADEGAPASGGDMADMFA